MHTGELLYAIQDEGDHVVLGVQGELSLDTAGQLRTLLDKLLLDRGQVIVDLAALRLRWRPTVGLFPTALAAAGGWPAARLVLAGADSTMTAALRAARVPLSVPLAVELSRAAPLLLPRPTRVSASRDLPRSAEAPRWARSLIMMKREDWAAPPLTAQFWDDAALVATELVTNAVEHAGTSSLFTLALDELKLHIGVRDRWPGGRVRRCDPDSRNLRGRGLVVVEALSRSWGVTPHDNGKTVWAVLSPDSTG